MEAGNLGDGQGQLTGTTWSASGNFVVFGSLMCINSSTIVGNAFFNGGLHVQRKDSEDKLYSLFAIDTKIHCYNHLEIFDDDKGM
jgi:hypothetical protein